jgi:hypothetical protein
LLTFDEPSTELKRGVVAAKVTVVESSPYLGNADEIACRYAMRFVAQN